MTTITPAQIIEAMDKAERCMRLAHDLLDPEMFGHAVTPEIRDAARRALGIAPCETTPTTTSFNDANAWRDAIAFRATPRPRRSHG